MIPSAFKELKAEGIGRMFIHGDDSRSAAMRRSKRFREEAFGRSRIAPRAQLL
jgi:hypothetical protein